MATGYTHRQVSLRLVIPTAVVIGILAGCVAGCFAQSTGSVAQVVTFIVVGWWYMQVSGLGAIFAALCTPDQDIQNTTWEEKQLRQQFPRFGRLWQAYWYPYAKVAKHRGWSHGWGLGALTRLVYTFWPAAIAIQLMDGWLPTILAVWLPFWLGMLGPDLGHLIADIDRIGDWLERRYRGAGFAHWYKGYRWRKRIGT